MKLFTLPWMDGFHCLCGDCTLNCCEGWMVPLDDEDRKRFRKEKGWLGIRLFFATGGGRRDHMNDDAGTCSFLGRDGLCRLQRKKGETFIPWACRHYPRFYRNYGAFEEVTLDLSCVFAAELFLKHVDELELVKTTGEAQTKPCSSNDDEEFLAFLLRLRREMMDMTRRVFRGEYPDGEKSGGECPGGGRPGGGRPGGGRSVLRTCERYAGVMLSFAEYLQDRCMRESEMAYDSVSFTAYVDKKMGVHGCSVAGDADGTSVDAPTEYGDTVAPAPFGDIDEADVEVLEKICEASPFLLPSLGAYLSYYLLQYFLRIYETYSFRRIVGLGLCHTNNVLRRVVEHVTENMSVRSQKKRERTSEQSPESLLAEDDLALIIANYNRKNFFNDEAQDEMYRRLDEIAQPLSIRD
ncbi:MAG: flagellin lysine-N-methylase [Eubacterium sp.]|nr:flagellin lysine-N-methylase [Eubacterium sp.]